MKKRYLLAGFAALALLAAPVAADEITIRIITEPDATADQVVNRIALPEPASATAGESSAEGLQRANRAREEREQFGRDRAMEQRDAPTATERNQAPQAPPRP